MVASIREQIAAAVVQVITNANTGAALYRSRQAAIQKIEGPVINVQARDEPVESLAGMRAAGVVKREYEFGVSLFIRSGTPETAADPIQVAFHAALMADPTLGGLCQDLLERGTEWREVEADATALEAETRYVAKYLTPRGALDKQA